MEAYFPETYLTLLKLLLKIFFITHFLACAWYFIGIPSQDCCPELHDLYPFCSVKPGNHCITWVRKYEVDRFPILSRYAASFYFITKTIMGVGYGDISPTNSGERLFCIFIQITGAVVFGLLLGGVSRIVDGGIRAGGVLALRLALVSNFTGKIGLSSDGDSGRGAKMGRKCLILSTATNCLCKMGYGGLLQQIASVKRTGHFHSLASA